ncbi:terpenoid synthase [Jaminaea rosea]|uniref:(2E,6E)-farnesyl diphosphate synthase n=1 Tax=Jaminaea rosea TaxID=1569628 RepID=A0A316UUN3_9BASI|nr:terpenoid synthase [Jaminaea rosea]PWN29020.1 terpenoid synthase [Jaminaea rosea]
MIPGPSSSSSALPPPSPLVASSSPSSSQQPWYASIRSHLSHTSPATHWTPASERSLLEPYSYLCSRPGKSIRSKLIDAFNIWLRVPEHRLQKVRKVVEMLHNASLLMDDVEDNSDLRRGAPVAHKVYGTPQVLNTSNYVYFLVFREIEAMGHERAEHEGQGSLSSASQKATQSERLLVEEMINLHRGQGLDLLWRDTLQCPTEEEYVEMVRNKTGGLLRIAGGLMTIWRGESEDGAAGQRSTSTTSTPNLAPLLDLIGLLFQIRDDYMNLDSDTYAHNKGFAEDLTEGKFSFPMIHGIRWSESNTNGGSGNQGVDGSSSSSSPASTSPARAAFPTAVASSSSSMPAARPVQPPIVAPAPSFHLRNRQLLSILSSRPTDEHLKRYAISYLRDVSRSFAYCRAVMRHIDAAIWKELEEVERAFGMQSEGNEQLRKILLALREGWWVEGEEDAGDEEVRGRGSSKS